MSDDAKPKKKKGGKGKLLVGVGAILVLGGGGAAGGYFVAGGFSAKVPEKKEDFNRPQLVLAGENPEEIATKFKAQAEAAEHEGAAVHPAKGVDLPTPHESTKYQATYFQIPSPFTSNLADSDSFAQVSVAVATYYDNRVIEAVKQHEMAIRSAVIMQMAQESEMALSTPAGKEALQGKIRRIVNDVLKAKTGYGGVDNVYFTNFVIQ